jgi:hypothetical protein
VDFVFVKIDTIRDEVIGLRPIYCEHGDITELYTNKGEVRLDRRSIRSVRKAFLRSYAIDLAAQVEMVKIWTGRAGAVPFYINNHRVFVALKMRKAISSNDVSYGYLDVNYIEDVIGESESLMLKLIDGTCLPLCCTYNTAARTLFLGQQLLARLEDENDNNDEAIIQAAFKIVISRFRKLEDLLLKIELLNKD